MDDADAQPLESYLVPAASSPLAPGIEIEPAIIQPRSIWVSARLLCGSVSFFFAAFLFAYFYLKALDVNGRWEIGPVHPSSGLGISIAALLAISAAVYRLAAKRPEVDPIPAGVLAILMGLAAIALQCIEYTTLGFGAASGGYAAVFYGWTVTYAVVALLGLYWIEIQVVSLWRVRREGEGRHVLMPQDEGVLLRAGVEASSFYWAYFAAIGVLAYVVLYLV